LPSSIKSIIAYYLALKHQDRTSAHFRAGQSLNPYILDYRVPFAFSTILFKHSHQHPSQAAFSSMEDYATLPCSA